MSRFKRVAALDVNDPRLPWIWAINEQEQIWLANDAYWARCAKNGWQNDDDVYNMLDAYGPLRGERGGSLSRSERASSKGLGLRSGLAAAAIKAASQLKAGDAAGNTREWIKLNHKVAELMGCQKSDWCMPSATLKLMWFSAPAIIPMYDQYAFAGVKKERPRTHGIADPSGYLGGCYDALERHEQTISSALDLWGSQYPYRVRILDKYLWLRGSGSTSRVRHRLERFHAACGSLAKTDYDHCT